MKEAEDKLSAPEDEPGAWTRTIADRLALEKLINVYHKAADAFDWRGWSETFTEDAVFEVRGGFGEMRGRAEIHDRPKAAMDAVYAHMQHIIVNADFEIEGDVAGGTANLVYIGVFDAGRPHEYYMAGGRYSWRFVRRPEGWRIARGLLEFLWNNGIDPRGFAPAGKGAR